MLEAPICTMIPGEPVYLPGDNRKAVKQSTASAMLESANTGNFDVLVEALKNVKGNDLRLYDFKNSYTNFMTYVNVLCRAGA